MLILDLTVRLRIAYSVKRFPIFDDSLNQANLTWINYCAYFYAFMAARLYSNQAVFENKVVANKSASVYNSIDDHTIGLTYSELTPGFLFVLTYLMITIVTIYYLLSYIFFECCPRFDFCPKCLLTRYWQLDKKVMVKRLPSFYTILSDEQRETLLIEEV